MIAKGLLLSVVIGLAMISLPVSGLAGHHDDTDDGPRPNAWHDHGWHNGWYKHHEDRDDEDQDEQGDEHHHYHPHVRYVAPASPSWEHRESDPDDHYRVCDMDGDDCRIVPNREPAYSCDEDGDDCHLVNQHYWGGYDYGPPVPYYESMAPSRYNIAQQRDWLIQRRLRAYQVLAKMRARHDRNAANRMLKVVNGLNARIVRDDQLISKSGYAAPVGAPYRSDPYGTPSNPNYGSAPAANPIGGIVGPLLGLPPRP
jgi:hypothetical protein